MSDDGFDINKVKSPFLRKLFENRVPLPKCSFCGRCVLAGVCCDEALAAAKATKAVPSIDPLPAMMKPCPNTGQWQQHGDCFFCGASQGSLTHKLIPFEDP